MSSAGLSAALQDELALPCRKERERERERGGGEYRERTIPECPLFRGARARARDLVNSRRDRGTNGPLPSPRTLRRGGRSD
jgi:hypothetical protein